VTSSSIVPTSAAPVTVAPPPPTTRPQPPALVAAPVVSTATNQTRAGQPVKLSGKGFQPHSEVKIVFEAAKREVVASVLTKSNGDFDASVMLPKTTPGQHNLQVLARSPSGQVMTWVEPVTVMASPAIAAVATGDQTDDLATPVLLSLAVALPLATWLILELVALRRRRAGGHGSAF
jgi:hypothetical protein